MQLFIKCTQIEHQLRHLQLVGKTKAKKNQNQIYPNSDLMN